MDFKKMREEAAAIMEAGAEAVKMRFRKLGGFWQSAAGVAELKKIHAANMSLNTKKGQRSRPVQFEELYSKYYAQVEGRLKRKWSGAWVGGTRKEARAFARKLAREEMRTGKEIKLEA